MYLVLSLDVSGHFYNLEASFFLLSISLGDKVQVFMRECVEPIRNGSFSFFTCNDGMRMMRGLVDGIDQDWNSTGSIFQCLRRADHVKTLITKSSSFSLTTTFNVDIIRSKSLFFFLFSQGAVVLVMIKKNPGPFWWSFYPRGPLTTIFHSLSDSFFFL